LKVFLLNPPVHKIIEKKDIPDYQHIGLGYLASAVVKEGYDVSVLDAKLERKSFDESIKIVEEYSPDILGLSAMTHQIEDAAEFVMEYKKRHPDTITVIGGAHITALPSETLKQYPQFNFGIAGEGEISFVELINMLKTGKSGFDEIAGLVYRNAKSVVICNHPERIKDINALPLPAWKFFPKIKTYHIITGRGCPYSCSFCMRSFGKEVKQRSVDTVIKEIKGVLDELKPEEICFLDETFIKDRKFIYDLCDQLIKHGINKKVKWSISATRVDSVDKTILKIIKDAGCHHIEFGVESGNSDILKKIKKGITKEQARAAVNDAKNLGYHVECGFILGHPDEKLETALETIDFAAKLNPSLIQLGIMVPYPGIM